MPWESVSELPENLRSAVSALPAEKRAQWLAAANRCLRDGGEEGSCIAQAWGAVRPGIHAELPAEAPEWVQLLTVGEWRGHPAVGRVMVTPAHLASALDQWERHFQAHGTRLVVDYHHASERAAQIGGKAPAAGWIDSMHLRGDGTELWAHVEWTETARGEIGRREYRYLSPAMSFGQPDRLTGQRVALQMNSVALTNQPFFTELMALADLGDESAMDGGLDVSSGRGGSTMTLVELMAQALEREPEQVASALGLESVEDSDVAEAVLAHAAELNELRGEAGRVPAVLADGLGLAADADETAQRAAVLRLKAPHAGMAAVRATLGLDADADEGTVLASIAGLQEQRLSDEAEALVDGAIEAGRIPPAHRDFYLTAAREDLAAARSVIEGMPAVLADLTDVRGRAAPPVAGLTDAQKRIQKLTGTSDETMKLGAEG